MINIDKRSVLTLEDFELQSLSQCVNIADNQYYLSELVNKYNKKTIYTWQEISVLKSRYFNLSNEFNFKNYLQKGKKIQLINRWPQTKMLAFMEIKEKFWLDNSESEQIQNNYQFQQEEGIALKNKYQLKKSKKIQKEKDKDKEKQKQKQRKKQRKDGKNDNENEKRKEIKQSLPLQRQIQDDQIQHSSGASLIYSKSSKWSSSQNKKSKKQKQHKQQQQKQKVIQQCKKGEYLRVKNIHISDDNNKQKQINYIVENILGENKIVTSSKLKKTHIFEVIAFLEHCLKIKKKQ